MMINHCWLNRQMRAFVCAGLVFALGTPSKAEDGQELPALGAKSDATSVSGISSGAYMAGQFQFAHARDVVGAAIIAGGPYGCAVSVYSSWWPAFGSTWNATRATSGCMQDGLKAWGVPNPGLLAAKAESLARAGEIDPLDDVRADRVYLFAGKADRIVLPPIVKAAADLYAVIGIPRERIRFVTDYSAGHAFVTETEGGSCELSEKPFVVDCDYDQAGDLLRHIYGDLNAASAVAKGQYLPFDQRPFAEGLYTAGLKDQGVVYIPEACRSAAGCRVHIAFHGCAQNRSAVGETFVRDTGFARWADTNRLVVLFPQVDSSFSNPQGCWDWWGYSGSKFLTREAPQIKAVHRMLMRLAGSSS